MDLYYTLTTYQLLSLLIKKMVDKADIVSVLYISDIYSLANQVIPKIQNLKLFDDIRIINDTKILAKYANIRENTVLDFRKSIIRDVEKELNKSLNDFENLHLGTDHFPIGIACAAKGREYIYYEESAGAYSNVENIYKNVKKTNNFGHYNLMKYFNLGGLNSNIAKRYINFNAQMGRDRYDNCFDFNVSEILRQLTFAQISNLLTVFNTNAIYINDNSKSEIKSLLLTEQFSNLNIISIEEQEALYKDLVDYFAQDDSLYIKPHPSDIQGCYKTIFDDAFVFDRQFPAELLPYCFREKFENCITVSSTAIKNIVDSIDNKVVFSEMILKSYKNIHKYYAAIEKIKLLEKDKIRIGYIGIDIKMLEMLLVTYLNDLDFELIKADDLISYFEIDILVVDIVKNESKFLKCLNNSMKSNLNTEIVFLNSNNQYTLFKLGDIENIYPIIIELDKNDIKLNDMVFLYTKNNSIKSDLKNLYVYKILRYNKTEMRIKEYCPKYTKTRKKELEGCIDATLEVLKCLKGNGCYNNISVYDNMIKESILEPFLRALRNEINNINEVNL